MRKWGPTLTAVAILIAAIFLVRLSASDDARYDVLILATIVGAACTVALYQFDRLGVLSIILIAGFLRAVLLPVPPTYSDDVYRYLWDGKLVSDGGNPYKSTPESVRSLDELREFRYSELNSSAYYSVYPPISQFTFAAAIRLGGGDWERSYRALKFILIVCEMLAVLLLARLVPKSSLVLYALNPAVIFEVAGQAHTEAIALPFLVLAIAGVRKYRWGISAVALAVATAVKLFPIILLPGLVRRTRLGAAFLFALAIVAIAFPFLQWESLVNASSSLRLYVQLFEFNSGPYLFIKEILLLLFAGDFSKQLGPMMALLLLGSVAVIYVRDKPSIPFADVAVILLGLFLLFSTTVHPWYLLPLLAVIALTGKPNWHWQWLSIMSAGTYLLYRDGPYWFFVWIGWGGCALLYVRSRGANIVGQILRWRARGKATRVLEFLGDVSGSQSLLDIGAAEGFVADALKRRTGASLQLVDMLPLNKTNLPYMRADAAKLPFPTNAFDHAILYFVLHHTADQSSALDEALRCARGYVLIVESTYRSAVGKRLLTFLDRFMNRVRSGGLMRAQEESLHFRTVKEWRDFFVEKQLVIVAEREWGSLLHRQVGFLISHQP